MNNNILIVGLGNIGDEYIHTRHNTGFIFVDKFVKLNHLTLSQEKYCNIAQLKVHNKYIFIIQPTTYMNLSGNAVKYISDKYNIALDNILVIGNKFKYKETIIEVNKYTTIGDITCEVESTNLIKLNIPLTVKTTKKSYNIYINTKVYQ